MLRLRNCHLEFVLDSDRGAEGRSLKADGTELLFQAPWKPAATERGAHVDEYAWTTAWPGGWQVLFPNAGEACVVDGRRHGFHGAASLAGWRVEGAHRDSVDLRWADDSGLTVTRHVELIRRSVRAATTITNVGISPAEFVLVEHIVFGEPLCGDGSLVTLPGGAVIPLADDGTRLTGRPSPWPLVAVGNDAPEDWSRGAPAPSSRFGVVTELPERRAGLQGRDARRAVEVRWSESLPYLWFWEERGAAGPPLAGVSCLGLEPASVSTSEGLAAARARGEATMLEPGGAAHFEVEIEVLP
jgi:Domain of unknown function (DUF4432)